MLIKASRFLLLLFVPVTIGIVLYAAGPWSQPGLGDMLVMLSILPLYAAFASGPYVLCHRMAVTALSPAQGWMYVVIGAALGIPAIGVYVEAFILKTAAPGDAGLAFVVIPAYQFVIIGTVIGVNRLWRRWRDQASR